METPDLNLDGLELPVESVNPTPDLATIAVASAD